MNKTNFSTRHVLENLQTSQYKTKSAYIRTYSIARIIFYEEFSDKSVKEGDRLHKSKWCQGIRMVR